MKDAPLKVEPEVVVDPKGTTANLSIPQLSLEAQGRTNGTLWSLDLTTQIKEIRSEQDH